METEIEAKFLAVNHDNIRTRLTELGATCTQKSHLTKRSQYDYPDRRLQYDKNAWIRIRDEGHDNKVTLSYKQLDGRTLHGTKEVSLIIDNFQKAEAFLSSIGLDQKSYHETKRESWVLHGVTIELDEWPWIKPFIEIEGPSEAAVRQTSEALGLAWKDAVYGSVEVAYQAEYNVAEEYIDLLPNITFDEPVPSEMLKARKETA